MGVSLQSPLISQTHGVSNELCGVIIFVWGVEESTKGAGEGEDHHWAWYVSIEEVGGGGGGLQREKEYWNYILLVAYYILLGTQNTSKLQW